MWRGHTTASSIPFHRSYLKNHFLSRKECFNESCRNLIEQKPTYHETIFTTLCYGNVHMLPLCTGFKKNNSLRHYGRSKRQLRLDGSAPGRYQDRRGNTACL